MGWAVTARRYNAVGIFLCINIDTKSTWVSGYILASAFIRPELIILYRRPAVLDIPSDNEHAMEIKGKSQIK